MDAYTSVVGCAAFWHQLVPLKNNIYTYSLSAEICIDFWVKNIEYNESVYVRVVLHL